MSRMLEKLEKLARRQASTLLIVFTLVAWAASSNVAAHLRARHAQNPADVTRIFGGGSGRQASTSSQNRKLPAQARFRYATGRGLIVRAWVNNVGPFDFAVDTGAGSTILSERVAEAARVQMRAGRRGTLGGLSSAAAIATLEGQIQTLAIGEQRNLLPFAGTVLVTSRLPRDVDGVLDPTSAFWPLGYVIDIPRGEISAFDPQSQSLKGAQSPPGGAIVPWLFDSSMPRPFVLLDGGKRALLDTGSGFGLGLSEAAARSLGIIVSQPRARIVQSNASDLAGGQIASRRIEPVTVRIGSLELRRIPTDLLSGVDVSAPIILGREALRPFRLTFDPVSRLIEFAPENQRVD